MEMSSNKDWIVSNKGVTVVRRSDVSAFQINLMHATDDYEVLACVRGMGMTLLGVFKTIEEAQVFISDCMK